jgi:hypothetical protein
MKLVIETSMSGTRYFARETVLYHHVTLIKIFQVWRGPLEGKICKWVSYELVQGTCGQNTSLNKVLTSLNNGLIKQLTELFT